MKGKVIGIIVVILMIICIPIVSAEECTYKNKAEALKTAKNVTAAYEIKLRDDGTYYVTITIYNITKELYVDVSSTYGINDKKQSGDSIMVVNGDTPIINEETFEHSGVYEIVDNDIESIKKYSFKVGSVKYNCSGSLKTFTLIKPKYNRISKIDECQYYDVHDNDYCKEWINSPITLSEEEVANKLKRIRELNRTKMTTVCYSCENDAKYEKWLARFMKLKMFAIIGLSIGIVADLVIIVLMIKKIREDRIV